MMITVEQYRTMSGDATTNDAAVSAAIGAAQSALEKYAQRWFEEDTRTETVAFDRNLVLLRGYPVAEIADVTGTDAAYTLDKTRGILTFYRPQTGEITVTYTGGYPADDLPDTLKWACAALAQALLSSARSDGRTVVSERLGDYQASFAEAQHSGLGSVSRIAETLARPFKGRGW